MSSNHLHVVIGAVLCGLLGIVLYRMQATLAVPVMNIWGIVSFASLGACLGCLIGEAPRDGFDGWF